MVSWQETKDFIEYALNLSSDSLHLIVGVIVLFAAALLLRKPVSSWWPWLVVLIATCINEIVDLLFDQWPDQSRQYGEGAGDLLLTMVIPTLLLLSTRHLPQLYAPRPVSERPKQPS